MEYHAVLRLTSHCDQSLDLLEDASRKFETCVEHMQTYVKHVIFCRWALASAVFNPVNGPNGTHQDYRDSGRPKQHYAVSADHWKAFIKYLGPIGEYLAENTEEGHKLRFKTYV